MSIFKGGLTFVELFISCHDSDIFLRYTMQVSKYLKLFSSFFFQGFMNISRCDNVTMDTYNFPRNHTLDLKVVVRKDTRYTIVNFKWRVVEGDPPEGETR